MERKLSFMELQYYRDKTLPSSNISLTVDNYNINTRNHNSDEKKKYINKTIDNSIDSQNFLLNQIDQLSKKYKELTISSKRSNIGTRLSKDKTSTKYKTNNTFSKI